MSSRTVLIVDDDEDQHAVVGIYLEHAGYAVLHAYGGREGVDLAVASRPSLILMDIRMPATDGRTAFRLLAEHASTRGIPVVATTADVVGWSEARSLQEGFAGHISKPCDLRRVREIIDQVVAASQSLAAA